MNQKKLRKEFARRLERPFTLETWAGKPGRVKEQHQLVLAMHEAQNEVRKRHRLSQLRIRVRVETESTTSSPIGVEQTSSGTIRHILVVSGDEDTFDRGELSPRREEEVNAILEDLLLEMLRITEQSSGYIIRGTRQFFATRGPVESAVPA